MSPWKRCKYLCTKRFHLWSMCCFELISPPFRDQWRFEIRPLSHHIPPQKMQCCSVPWNEYPNTPHVKSPPGTRNIHELTMACFSWMTPNHYRMTPNHYRMTPNHYRMTPNHYRMTPNHWHEKFGVFFHHFHLLKECFFRQPGHEIRGNSACFSKNLVGLNQLHPKAECLRQRSRRLFSFRFFFRCHVFNLQTRNTSRQLRFFWQMHPFLGWRMTWCHLTRKGHVL